MNGYANRNLGCPDGTKRDVSFSFYQAKVSMGQGLEDYITFRTPLFFLTG